MADRADEYRSVARGYLAGMREADGVCPYGVETHAHVHVTEGGAFVEAVIWVPDAALPPQLLEAHRG